VRTVVEDLGKILGCGAHIKELRRCVVGSYNFRNKNVYSIDYIRELKSSNKNCWLNILESLLYPVDIVVSSLHVVQLSEEEVVLLQQGKFVSVGVLDVTCVFVRVYHFVQELDRFEFIGIAEVIDRKYLHAKRLINLKTCNILL
jgi:tRNA pseudouridine55 synthase